MALTKVNSVGIATGISLTGITTTQDAKIGTGITLSPDGNVYATGVVTATSYRGDVSNCTGVGQTNFIDAESLNVSGISTFTSKAIVGSGITLSPDGDIFATGISTFNSRVLIGTDTEGNTNADDLTVANSGEGGITIRSGASSGGNIYFSDATSGGGEYAGMIEYKHNTNDLLFGTNSSEKVRITSAGTVGINRSSPDSNSMLDVMSDLTGTTVNSNRVALFRTNGGGRDAHITLSNSSNTPVHIGQLSSNLYFTTNSAERVRIDTSGRVLIGTTDTDSVSDGEVSKLIVKGTDSTASGTFVRHSADAGGTGIYFGKSRNATVGSNTIVQASDELGRITFSGDDGTNINTMGAKIAAYVDGTPGENDMPGRLVFYTTADGASSVTERMRILQTGDVNIGNAGGTAVHHASGLFNGVRPKFEIKLGAAANSYTRYINIMNPGAQTGSETLGRVGIKLSLGSEASSGESNKSGAIYAESTSGYNNGTSLCFGVGGSERARIDSSGRVLIGHSTSMFGDQKLQISSTSSTGSIMLGRWSNSNYSSYLNFFKSRHATVVDGGGTVVQAGDILGMIGFYGDDGSNGGDNKSLGASISCEVAGTPGNDDMPGRLVFKVSPDNSETAAERFHIDDAGARVTGTLEAYPSSTSPISALTCYNNSTGASADCRVQIKTYANQGGDPYIHFDSGGSNCVVGQLWGGTNLNRLVMGFGDSPQGGVSGIHMYGSGEWYQNLSVSQTTASSANMYWNGADGRLLRSTSSIRYKTNVQTLLDSDADKILQCRPVTYQPKEMDGKDQGSDTSKTFYGLIAEEVELIDPRLVGHDTEGTIQNVEYERFVPHLINLIKRQSAKIETLETKVAALESA